MTFVLTGLDVDAKVALVEAAIRARLDGDPGIKELRFTRIGNPAAHPDDQMEGSSLLHVSVDGERASAGRPFSSLCVELALASYPGIYSMGVPGSGSQYGVYWPTLVPQRLLQHTVVHPDGRREVIPPPPEVAVAPLTGREGVDPTTKTARAIEPRGEQSTEPAGESPSAPARESLADGAFVRDGVSGCAGDEPVIYGPLGRLVHARSGDKGGNANVGLWVSDAAAWPWLRATMTVERLRELLPEASALDIDRYELPNLRAVNFVIKGLLDGGATEARRFDKQAKALGEWLRARHVPLPAQLLPNAS